MRSLFRGRTTNQRGYVLISAIALAVLYFGLMELMLIDSSRALREAQRFRSRVVASALAESAAELAAAQMVTRPVANANASDEQGQMTGALRVNGSQFELTGEGVTAGVAPVTATVRVQGRIENNHIAIDYTFHSQ
ncbi:MAG TPA: hypothetical protein VGA10_13520 [Thermoanaerobaculia bacterium]|jgi:hypothetical protein